MAAFGPGNEPHFLFETSGTDLQVVDFSVRERISAPFEVDLTLASEDEIQFDDVVGQPALLTVRGDDTDRYFNGIINQFVQTGMSGRFYLYQTRMVPSLWLLSLEQDCRIFQDLSTQDIVSQILEETGITADLFDFRLQNPCTQREYCVQYRETDLNFISRLLEEEGIFYFFEHLPEMHVMIIGDSAVNYQAISGQANVVFNPTTEMIAEEEAVNRFILSRRIRSNKVTLRDFNFAKPDLDLTATKQGDKKAKLEIYDYPGIYSDEKIGKKLALIRLQEAVAYTDRAEGDSCCSRLTSGFTFNLTGHDLSNFNQEYLLAEVLHNGSQPQVLEERADSATEFSYANQFLAIPSAITFRPERTTPKPVVEGVHTAIVSGPDSEEIYTDEDGLGRVKVKFHWDREDRKGEERSCWIRVSQVSAGAGWGAIDVPRIGHEVIVDFIEGNPDRPIITGRVYHGENRPPFDLPAGGMVSGMKSNTTPGGGGFNEISMNDTKGKEALTIHAQKDMSTKVENDMSTTVGNDRTATIKKGDDKITVTKGDRITNVNTGDEKLTVKGDRIVTVEGDSKQDVLKGDHALTIKKGKADHSASKQITITSETAYILVDASTEIMIKSGESSLHMKKDGTITLSGKKIQVTGGDEVKMGVSNQNVTCDKQKVATSGASINSSAVGMHEIAGALVKIN